MKKLITTVQTSFPAPQPSRSIKELGLSKLFGRNRGADYGAMALFPDEPGALYITIGEQQEHFMDAVMARKRNARIVSFEPNPYLYQRLAGRYAQAASVTVYDWTLGDKESKSVLHVPFYRNYRFDGLTSPDSSQAADGLKRELYWYNQKFLSLKQMSCQVKPLDDLDLRPSLIRLTTKGCKLSMLAGAKRTLRAFVPVLLIKDATEEVTIFLKKFGYRNYRWGHAALTPGYGDSETFYVVGDAFQKFRNLLQQTATARKGV